MKYIVYCEINNAKEVARFHEYDDAELFINLRYGKAAKRAFKGQTLASIHVLKDNQEFVIAEIRGEKPAIKLQGIEL